LAKSIDRNLFISTENFSILLTKAMIIEEEPKK
jgi:hypothetical protein